MGCGFGWAEGSTSSVIFARWCQCSGMGGHIGTTWRIRLNHLSAAAMQSYVRLLCRLVIIRLLPVYGGLSISWTDRDAVLVVD